MRCGMDNSTKWWIGLGLVLAALFFVGAVTLMLLTDETIKQEEGTPRETAPVDSIRQEDSPGQGDFIQILWPAGGPAHYLAPAKFAISRATPASTAMPIMTMAATLPSPMPYDVR